MARTCGFRASVGKTSMDFSLSALRFIVAVSFFGFNVRVLDSLINAAPSRISQPRMIEAELHGSGVQLYGLTDETNVCCETETQEVDLAGPRRAGSRCDLDTFLLSCG
jgi:hypothetical protein